MKLAKERLRKKFILIRKKNYIKSKIFNFYPIFKIIKKHFFKKRIAIAAYYPSNYEVNILKFIELALQKKLKICLPVIGLNKTMTFKSWKFKEPLYVNSFGILEPNVSNKTVTPHLILVPLVAFDKKLNRIGYGKGYYDRYLNKIKRNNKNVVSVGIAYSFQQCSSIPTNKHDFRLDYIFTERGIISSIK